VKPRTAHPLEAAARARGVPCDLPRRGSDALEFCPEAAVMCEVVPTRMGSVAFYHYCAECWLAPAANGGPSAADRTGVELPDVLDFERRWLAECRAHGETRRKLALAHHELGEHSMCGADCTGDHDR